MALNTAADIYWTPRSTKHLFNKPHCTPLRTPKLGVRRGPEPHPQEEERILGTPDYLAPEILLQEKHGILYSFIHCVCLWISSGQRDGLFVMRWLMFQ